VRGFQPWPGCYGFLHRQRLHIWKAVKANVSLRPGELSANGRRLFAGCGDQSIELLEVQLEGKKRMPSAAFLNGNTVEPGEILQ
jgi:methionyl-tRNA formyltransferase